MGGCVATAGRHSLLCLPCMLKYQFKKNYSFINSGRINTACTFCFSFGGIAI